MIVSRTGALYESVASWGPVKKSGLFNGGIQWESPAARILEWGGRTRAHWIRPKRAKALRWIDPLTGDVRFSKGHLHPGSEFIPRLILTRGLTGSLPEIARKVESSIQNRAINKVEKRIA